MDIKSFFIFTNDLNAKEILINHGFSVCCQQGDKTLFRNTGQDIPDGIRGKILFTNTLFF